MVKIRAQPDSATRSMRKASPAKPGSDDETLRTFPDFAELPEEVRGELVELALVLKTEVDQHQFR